MQVRLDPKGTDYPYLKKLPWKTGDRWLIEREMIRRGGKLNGVGEGLAFHYKAAVSALWYDFHWHKWAHLLFDHFPVHSEVTVLGPASSSKTYCSAAYGLVKLFVFEKDTTIMGSTTNLASLQGRIWGAIKELFKRAKERRPWLPGRVVESKHVLTMSQLEEEAQDYRDGFIGIACKQGDQWVGLGNYVGWKNLRVMLIADEAHLMQPGFLDSVSNLRKNPDFQLIALGNPKDPTDPLGKSAEPAAVLGGWDGYDATPKTKTWKTRVEGAIAIQLSGLESPNHDYPRGINPYKYLIKPEDIAKDVAQYGEASIQVQMMNYGVMPRAGTSRRVLDLLLCERNKAFDHPVWAQRDQITHVAFVDAAYSGVGGDRCVYTHLGFGPDLFGGMVIAFMGPQIVIPVNPSLKETAEDQIARWSMSECISRNIKATHFGFDSTGRGSLTSSLMRVWSTNVVAIEFGGDPDAERSASAADDRPEIEVYSKKVTALWYSSRLVVEAQQFRSIPRQAVEEAQMREWTIKAKGNSGNPRIEVEPKDKMRKRLGRSPDLWDSACGALEMARRHGFVIASTTKTGLSKPRVPDWINRRQEAVLGLRRRHALLAA